MANRNSETLILALRKRNAEQQAAITNLTALVSNLRLRIGQLETAPAELPTPVSPNPTPPVVLVEVPVEESVLKELPVLEAESKSIKPAKVPTKPKVKKENK
jgi:hypothetical protein